MLRLHVACGGDEMFGKLTDEWDLEEVRSGQIIK
jgi:hypothetical protein